MSPRAPAAVTALALAFALGLAGCELSVSSTSPDETGDPVAAIMGAPAATGRARATILGAVKLPRDHGAHRRSRGGLRRRLSDKDAQLEPLEH